MFAALQAATLPDLTGNRKYVHDDSYFYDQDIDDSIDPLAYIDNPYDDHDVYGDHDLDDYDIGDYYDYDDDEDDY